MIPKPHFPLNPSSFNVTNTAKAGILDRMERESINRASRLFDRVCVPHRDHCAGGRSEAHSFNQAMRVPDKNRWKFKRANLHSVGLIKQLVRNWLSLELLKMLLLAELMPARLIRRSWPSSSGTVSLLDSICGCKNEKQRRATRFMAV
jgi:hypothetical protein